MQTLCKCIKSYFFLVWLCGMSISRNLKQENKKQYSYETIVLTMECDKR